MNEHPKLHEAATLCVEIHKEYGRVRYSPCNMLAHKFLQGLEQKTFMDHDLKWIKSLGYDVLVMGSAGTDTKEFE